MTLTSDPLDSLTVDRRARARQKRVLFSTACVAEELYVHRFRESVVHHGRRNKAGKETGLEEESEKMVKGNGKRETRGKRRTERGEGGGEVGRRKGLNQ